MAQTRIKFRCKCFSLLCFSSDLRIPLTKGQTKKRRLFTYRQNPGSKTVKRQFILLFSVEGEREEVSEQVAGGGGVASIEHGRRGKAATPQRGGKGAQGKGWCLRVVRVGEFNDCRQPIFPPRQVRLWDTCGLHLVAFASWRRRNLLGSFFFYGSFADFYFRAAGFSWIALLDSFLILREQVPRKILQENPWQFQNLYSKNPRHSSARVTTRERPGNVPVEGRVPKCGVSSCNLR